LTSLTTEFSDKTEKALTVNFVGDISLTDLYEDLFLNRGPMFPFEEIRDRLGDCTFLAGNLESPLTTAECFYPHKTSLRANPGYVEALKCTGFDILNLSNNHILDYKEPGVAQTTEALGQAGIKYFGYGKSRRDALKMVCCEDGGVRIGFMGYTNMAIDSPFWADEDVRGIAQVRMQTLEDEIARNRSETDVLVISVHWGHENFWLPSPDQRSLAHKMIDYGATAVIGHHPHVLQGIESYNGGLIAYSLGNFVFSTIRWKWSTKDEEERITTFKLNARSRESVILQIGFDKDRVKNHSVIGVCIGSDGRIRTANHVPARVQHLSDLLKTADYDAYFNREMRMFEKRARIMTVLSRLTRLHKLRPKHFSELVRSLKGFRIQ
jgi:hypothetical protein